MESREALEESDSHFGGTQMCYLAFRLPESLSATKAGLPFLKIIFILDFYFPLYLADYHIWLFENPIKGFPGGAVVRNLPANAGDTGSSPGLGRSHMPWSN